MKKLATIIAALLLAATTFAQVPQGFSYQAVFRNAQNEVLANTTMDVTVTITASVDGSVKSSYSETHKASTSANGQMTLFIGEGVSSQKFADFKWNIPNAVYNMEVETKYGKNTAQLLSVPFAFYAANAGSVDNAQLISSIGNTDVKAALSLAMKSDLESLVQGYATNENVTTALANALGNYVLSTSLADYATNAKLNDTLAYYEKVSDAAAAHANFVTKTELSNTLSSFSTTEALKDSLSKYVTKAELESILDSYATKSYVNTEVSSLKNFILKRIGLELDDLKEELSEAIAPIAKNANSATRQSNTGRINGVFSVSASKKVYFSNGNLQYQASTNTWRFAEHQYDICASNNTSISSTYSGWIDLFGWATSGYSNGGTAYQPYSTSKTSTDYKAGTNGTSLAGTKSDWGVYNAISNGGNAANQWRTLTCSEMNYLLNTRTDANYKWSLGIVGGRYGLILLPDEWILPLGLEFNSRSYAAENNYTLSQWELMEANGAVFLPMAGLRSGYTYKANTTACDYWLADAEYKNNTQYGRIVSLNNGATSSVYTVRLSAGETLVKEAFNGLPVRLVQDVK